MNDLIIKAINKERLTLDELKSIQGTPELTVMYEVNEYVEEQIKRHERWLKQKEKAKKQEEQDIEFYNQCAKKYKSMGLYLKDYSIDFYKKGQITPVIHFKNNYVSDMVKTMKEFNEKNNIEIEEVDG